MSKKKELTMSEFRTIVKEEATKLKTKLTLEAEKKALTAKLNTLSTPSEDKSWIAEGMVKEGATPMSLEEAELHQELFGIGKGKEEKMKKTFLQYAGIWKQKGAIRGMNQEMLDDLMVQAAADNYEGKPGVDQESQLMIYRPASDINWAGLGLNQGGSFGGTQ